MARDILYKTKAEKVSYAIDFVADVPSGAAILSVTSTALDSSGASATTALIDSTANSGTVVTVKLKATSTDKETYTVTVQATMNDAFGSIAERILEVRIRNEDTVE